MPTTTDTAIELMRPLAAELVILDRYDILRNHAGHDYGCGQRSAELMRRRRELETVADRFNLVTAYPTPTRAELLAAWVRVGAPRLRRARSEKYRSETPATRRTIGTWQRVYGWVCNVNQEG